jgi:hypothetical protein
LRTLPYEVDGREARRYEIGHGEYLDAEVYDGFFTLTWSTDLRFRDVMEQLKPELPTASGHALVFDTTRQEHREVDASELLDDVSRRKVAYPFIRCEFDGLTLVWQQPLYPKHVDEDVTPGKLGIISESFDADYYADFVRRTATRRLGKQAAALLDDASFVASHVNAGRPGSAA